VSKPMPVWVNGKRYEGPAAAAREVSRRSGLDISGEWVFRALTSWGGSVSFGRITISRGTEPEKQTGPGRKAAARAAPAGRGGGGFPRGVTGPGTAPAQERTGEPETEYAEPPPAPRYKAPLLSFRRGEAPSCRGVCRAER
jgi:hypothetical protein